MDAKGIPISWLAVESIQEGEQWYREHTKMPECMIHYIARPTTAAQKFKENIEAQMGDVRRMLST
eukprot:SAG22_NODE_3537_length_1655_cov_23.267959_1_plen_65_part_00